VNYDEHRVEFYIDLDGTLAGNNEWTGFFRNTLDLFKGLKFKIPIINWSILTSRPRIDRPIVKLFCKKFKLYPKQIITTDTWLYTFKDYEEIAIWKSNVLLQRANDSNLFVDKIVYVDNDIKIRSKIIGHPKLVTCSSRNINSAI